MVTRNKSSVGYFQLNVKLYESLLDFPVSMHLFVLNYLVYAVQNMKLKEKTLITNAKTILRPIPHDMFLHGF